MSGAAAHRRARDGGICRIKLPGGELSAAQAIAIAEASRRHASGVIELTNRANLQVRGVRSGQEAALIATLLDAGLGPAVEPIRADAAVDAAKSLLATSADDVRNVMLSPTAGRDPFALFDTRPLCTELLALLQTEARFAALSPKFALLLDGGERLARVDHPHDVWLAATQAEDGVRFVFGLAGCPAAEMKAKPGALGAVLPKQVTGLVRALLHTFLDLAAADATRMRHLLTAHSIDAVLQHARQYVDFPLSRDASLAHWQRGTLPMPRCGSARMLNAWWACSTRAGSRRLGASTPPHYAASRNSPSSTATARCASRLGKAYCFPISRRITHPPRSRK